MRDESVAEVLAQMASGAPGPSAGSAAGLAAAMAAALVAKTARLSGRQLAAADELADADELAEEADTWRERALALAEADAAGVRALLTSGTDAPTDPSAIPAQIGEVAAAVERLAATLAEQGNPRLHADAVAAGQLAGAAGISIDAILRSNAGAPGAPLDSTDPHAGEPG
ncbi:cyclodeaminase/cyclohydrolase family protein [Ruania zhangjianzhongii]|uniref:cyclodeaminase/cyclohydrolase family protein n=1 Tax=Ruania zhangjianzhongii TaxID=2603206 RepID=UPI0011C8C184|nr:cyclodeaminase/cyclohydrolase family protein [Ruania zhangjianzhongii]